MRVVVVVVVLVVLFAVQCGPYLFATIALRHHAGTLACSLQDDIVVWCCLTLANVSQDLNGQFQISADGGVERILLALQTHVMVPPVVEACCTALAEVARLPGMPSTLLSLSMLPTLLATMDAHESLISVQRRCCALLALLSTDRRCHAAVVRAGGIPRLIRTMARFDNDAALVTSCLHLVSALVRADDRATVLPPVVAAPDVLSSSSVLDVVLRVMTRHEGNGDVVGAACRVLAEVFLDPSQRFVDQRESSALKCVNVAAGVMSRFEGSPDVRGHANALIEALIKVLGVSADGSSSSPIVMEKLEHAHRRFVAAVARSTTPVLPATPPPPPPRSVVEASPPPPEPSR